MHLSIGNAPCSWGVEFADDPRNPPWTHVLDEAKAAGYTGIELGPLGFMPEDPAILGPALAERELTLIGGVLFRPFHDPAQWTQVRDAAIRTCRALTAHRAKRLVLIDSISPRRAPTAGRSSEAERLRGADRAEFLERIESVARIGVEEFGLEVTMHAHAAGFVEFEDELEDVLGAIDGETDVGMRDDLIVARSMRRAQPPTDEAGETSRFARLLIYGPPITSVNVSVESGSCGAPPSTSPLSVHS